MVNSPPNVIKSIGCEESFIHEEEVKQAQAYLVESETAARLAQTFQALSDPTRIRLISTLTSSELCVCDLAALLGMSQSAVSHQLRSLRDLRLVKSRRAGREIFYTLDDDHIRELFELGLKHVQHD